MRKGIEENGRRKRTEGKRKAVILWSGDKTGCGESGKMAVPGGSGWLCHRGSKYIILLCFERGNCLQESK